jgi:hypothetical protein
MSQFEPLTRAGKKDGMVPHGVAAPEGMHPDFRDRAFRADAFAAMFQGKGMAPSFQKDVRQRGGRSAGGILFLTVMDLDDLQVKALLEDLRGLARQPKQSVHAHRKI